MKLEKESQNISKYRLDLILAYVREQRRYSLLFAYSRRFWDHERPTLLDISKHKARKKEMPPGLNGIFKKDLKGFNISEQVKVNMKRFR